MAVTVTRIYDTEDKARQVAVALQPLTMQGQVTVVTPSQGNAAQAMLAANGMSVASARAYAAAVTDGRSVVSVAPSFGFAARVTQVMDAAGPVDTHIVDVPDAPEAGAWGSRPAVDDPATPLSSRFGWPVLSDDPTPVSRKFGWRVLLDDPAPLSTLLGWRVLSPQQEGRAKLIDDAAPLSKKFGWRLLLDDATPVSNRFGWRVLKDDAAPASRKLGWRILSGDQPPRATLMNDPAPLSRWLGLRVLSRDRSPEA